MSFILEANLTSHNDKLRNVKSEISGCDFP